MTVNELKRKKIIIRGYAMPDDNAPCFYTKCILRDAMQIMKEYIKDIPEDFYNFHFYIADENDDCLFSVRREFDKIYLGRGGRGLNEAMVKEALGME